LAATIRTIAAEYRSSFMEDLPGLHGGRSVGPTMQLGISRGIFKPRGHDRGRSSRPAFSGFDVPATGQGRGPFHRYIPICRPFCRISPGIRALFEALPAAKYRSPLPWRPGPRWGGCRMAAQRSGGASEGRPSISRLADFLTPLQALMRPRPGLTQSFKRQPFQALSLLSVLAGRTPPPI
jgi:hypothetical protein